MKIKRLLPMLWLCVLSMLGVPASAAAQSGPDNDPDGAPGYVKSVFDHGQVDSINLYNGQLTLPLPLGPSYPIGPRLSVQLALTYNSQVDNFGKPLAQSADYSYRPLSGNPSLGIGWSLTLGAIKSCQHGNLYGVCFQGPDGSQHMFNRPQANGSITGDASPLFLRGTGPYDMWDGDGNHYEFGNAGHVTGYDAAATDFAKGRDGWYLTRLTDPFGNSYAVSYWSNINPLWTYSLPPQAPCLPGVAPLLQMPPTGVTGPSWIPKDVTLPSGQKIHVNTGSNGFIGSMITSIDFPVLVNGTLATRTWDFDYSAPEAYAKDCGGGTTLNVNLQELSAINLPSDLAGQPGYRFAYIRGLLTKITLPTSGSIAYCYALYHFHHGRAGAMRPGCGPLTPPETELVLTTTGQFCDGSAIGAEPIVEAPPGECVPDNPNRWVDNQWGITRRTEIVGTATNVTTYSQIAMPRGESGAEPQTLTIVKFPPTDKNGSSDPGRQRAKAVLFASSPRILGPWPAAARNSVPGDRVGAALEERTFEIAPSYSLTNEPFCTGDAATDEGFCGSKAIRVAQSTYEYDDPANLEGDRRLQKEKTIYGASACASCASHQVAFSPSSTWESNGRHYDVETHSGTMGGDSRTITTDWAPANWPGGSPSGAPVLPNLLQQRTTVQGSSTRDEYLEFDTANGFLKGSFVYDSARDIAFVNCRYNDGAGNADKEFTRTLATSTTPARTYCSGNYPNFPGSVGMDGDMFGKDFAYQNGQLLRAGWIKGSGTPPFFFKNLARDATTGWITASTDSAGLTTAYQYDSLGRVLWIDPTDDLSTFVCYESAAATSAYRAAAKQSCPVPATNPALTTWSHYDYDGLGRLVREKRLQPAGALSKRFTLYDAVGNARFNSEWVADSTAESVSANLSTACVFPGGNYGTARPSSAPGTYRLCFDPFGRPQQVVGAKHSSLSTTDRADAASPYSDTRETVLTYCLNATFANQQAATCGTGGLNATVVTQKDALGRVSSVTEPGGDLTSYAYDVNGKLTAVTQGGQSRSFAYDAAGFLRSETTPERSTVTYSSIGSLGNVRAEIRPGGLTVTRLFDFAGRPTEEDAGGNRYVVNCWDGSGSCVDGSPNFAGGARPNGKLTRRYGYNWIPTMGPVVDEQFTYGGASGRLSQLVTAVGNGDLSAAAAQTWTHDGLGLVATHAHPRITGAFTLANTATNGLFIRVNANGTDVVKAATYNPAAGLASWTAGNSGSAIITTVAQDSTLLPRPASIANALWSSGTYAYDSVGDVLATGQDTFQYDARARLVGATYGGVPRTFAYDRYGNLTRNGATTWTIDAATNRMKPTAFGAPQYDARGNLAAYNGETMSYDSLDRQYRDAGAGADWVSLYDGEGERIARFPAGFSVLRREMARQIAEANVLARGWTLPACTASPFSDVSCADPDARYINLLYQQGITGGCATDPLQFCPDRTITRAEMAVFIVKGYKGAAYVPPACTGRFQDVACGGPYALYAPFIEQLYNDGVTVGCSSSPLQFCPANSIGEWETAVWMAKAPTTPPGGAFWAAYHPVPRGTMYTFRDEQNRVVTEMAGGLSGASTATLSVARDNAFLGNLMVASYASGAWTYSASDHLGSPRVIWDSSGQPVETHKYWPYGEDTTGAPPNQRLAYCLMERDTEASHYYDHARHHDFGLGRFLTPDSVGGHPANPQSWNRYAYTLGNPLKYLDPDGNVVVGFTGLFNDPRSGVHDVVASIAHHPFVGKTQVFRHQDIAKALGFIKGQLDIDPNQPVIVAGHSRGAASALELVRRLQAMGIKVDLLLTIDPVMIDPEATQRVPKNVRLAVNYWENQSSPLGGMYLVGDPSTTDVENRRIAEPHGLTDDHVAKSSAELDALMKRLEETLQRKHEEPQ